MLSIYLSYKSYKNAMAIADMNVAALTQAASALSNCIFDILREEIRTNGFTVPEELTIGTLCKSVMDIDRGVRVAAKALLEYADEIELWRTGELLTGYSDKRDIMIVGTIVELLWVEITGFEFSVLERRAHELKCHVIGKNASRNALYRMMPADFGDALRESMVTYLMIHGVYSVGDTMSTIVKNVAECNLTVWGASFAELSNVLCNKDTWISTISSQHDIKETCVEFISSVYSIL